MSVLTQLPETVQAVISAALPDLRSCGIIWGKLDLKEIKKRGAGAPAVLVSVQGAREDLQAAGHAHGFGLSMAAYVITANGRAPKEVAAAEIAATLMQLIPDQYWDLSDVGEARDVRLHVLDTHEVRDIGVSLWAVTWIQPITFFHFEQIPMTEGVA